MILYLFHSYPSVNLLHVHAHAHGSDIQKGGGIPAGTGTAAPPHNWVAVDKLFSLPQPHCSPQRNYKIMGKKDKCYLQDSGCLCGIRG